jgi:hypothetical protein
MQSTVSFTDLQRGMNAEELAAFLEPEVSTSVREYLQAPQVYAEGGVTLSEFVKSDLCGKSGVWPEPQDDDNGDPGFVGTRVQSELQSAIDKASATLRLTYPILSETGMYKD